MDFGLATRVTARPKAGLRLHQNALDIRGRPEAGRYVDSEIQALDRTRRRCCWR